MTEPVSLITSVAAAIAKKSSANTKANNELFGPARKEFGEGLGRITKNSMEFVELCVFGKMFNKTETKRIANTAFIRDAKAKFDQIPEENQQAAPVYLAGPLFESAKYAQDEESLRQLYVNLLVSSMDTTTVPLAHVAYVEIIKQMSPDEARLFKYCGTGVPLPLITVIPPSHLRAEIPPLIHFSTLGEDAGCIHPDLMETHIDNLCRLGLITMPPDEVYSVIQIYRSLINHPVVVEYRKYFPSVNLAGSEMVVKSHLLRITPFGKQFYKVCVGDEPKEMPGVSVNNKPISPDIPLSDEAFRSISDRLAHDAKIQAAGRSKRKP